MDRELSDKSKAIYQGAITTICRAFNSQSLEILKEHGRVITWIESLDKSHNTKKIYYIALVSTLKRLADPTFAGALSAYKAKQDAYNQVVKEQMERQEMSAREEENFLAWPEVLKTREAARQDAKDLMTYQDYVLVCLYTYLPPIRLDYSPMAVVQEEPTAKAGNYLLVLPAGLTFILNDYKTSKRYGQKRTPVPKELERILRDWLDVNPSGWLLCNSDGEPLSEKALGSRLSQVFKKFSGKSVSVNLLRHSFVSWLRRNEKPLLKHKEIAGLMGHSLEMNALYRRI